MILHANWMTNSAVMAFWIEREADDSDSDLGSIRNEILDHPNCFDFDDIEDVLPEQLELFEDERILLLPSLFNPTHSTENIQSTENVKLKPWLIPTAESLSECVLEFFFRGDIEGLKKKIKWGESLNYWYELAKFARHLYEEESYAPGVVQLESKVYPSWQIVFSEDAEPYWNRFMENIPPICCAVHEEDDNDIRQFTPTLLTLSFADACVDYLSRRRLMRRAPKQVSSKKSNSPLHRQWLNTLKYGQFRELNGSNSMIHQFNSYVESWTDYMRPACFEQPWRLSFELNYPEVENGPWLLEFSLSSVKNLNLKVSAEQIWYEESVGTHIPNGRELLLKGLGQALTIFPKLRESLNKKAPVFAELDKEEAVSFMMEFAPELRRMGFIIHLPEWWNDNKESLGIQLKVNTDNHSYQDGASFLGLQHLVEYKWEISIGEQTLSEEEFRELAKMKQRLIFRNGRWLKLDIDSLNNSIEFFNSRGRTGKANLTEVLGFANELKKASTLPLLNFEILDRDGNVTNETQVYRELEQPEGLNGTLWEYQLQGYSWLTFIKNLGLGACLADDMGLGKTIQMIAVLLKDIEEHGPDHKSLIICPMSVVGNWVKEIEAFGPSIKVMVHHGSDRNSGESFRQEIKDYNVVITTYNLIVRDQTTFKPVKWRNIILDEAQSIKNPGTKQASSIRSLDARNRFCLTGTPVENRLTELWSIMDFLNPDFLGTLSTFRSSFSQPIERDQDESRSKILQRIIKPFILRRLKSDKDIVKDLPEKREVKVYCHLSAEQAGLYQAVVEDMLNHLNEKDGIERKGLVLSTLTKLKQITNHPRHFLRDDSVFNSDRSGKLQRLEEMIETLLDAGDKALIFSQFTEIGGLLKKKLEDRFGIEVLYMHGGTSKSFRDEMIHRFQSPNGPPLFLLSLKAGGVGLNLTAANHVFHFDRWWNPAIEDQATDRSYRIGQRKNVQVYKFICPGTVEEKIDQMIEEKKRLAEYIVETKENMLTELSTEELRNIFALSRDAVVG